MGHLKIAQELINNAWNDLKNDVEVRNAGIHTSLEAIERALKHEQERLKQLGYT